MPQHGIEVIDYIKNPLTKAKLSALITKMGISPQDLVRTREPIWVEHYKGKDLSNAEIVEILAANPRLIERPIVETPDAAVICRPPELVLELMT